LLPLVVAGCAGHPELCPKVVNYDSATETSLANAINTLPPDSVLRRMINDYGVMRAEARDCQADNAKKWWE
jgi:hypothetical protein